MQESFPAPAPEVTVEPVIEEPVISALTVTSFEEIEVTPEITEVVEAVEETAKPTKKKRKRRTKAEIEAAKAEEIEVEPEVVETTED